MREMQIRQETCCSGRLFATIVLASGDSLTCTDGVATDPRSVSLGFSDCRRNSSASACCPCRFTLTGEVDSALNRITGTLSCSCSREWDFCDGQQPITVVR